MADSSYNYKKVVIDYTLLNDAATSINGLSPEINRIKNSVKPEYHSFAYTVPGQNNANNVELGPGTKLYEALGSFYAKWGRDMSNAMDALEKMAGYFKGVADSFMETDASQAAGLNVSGLTSALMRYPVELDQWAKDEKAYMNKHPDGMWGTPAPMYPFSPYQLTSTNAATTTYTTQADTNIPSDQKSQYGKNVVLASETTTVTVGSQTYSETTTYGADQGWVNGAPVQNTTQVIHNPDGSTDTITMTTDLSGKGTMTDLNSASKDTTTYTRSDWNSGWVDTTPKDTSGDDDGGDVDAAPLVN